MTQILFMSDANIIPWSSLRTNPMLWGLWILENRWRFAPIGG